MSETQLLYVPLALLDELWPQLAPFIEQARALSVGEYALEDIHQQAKAKKCQLWALRGAQGLEGAGVTRIVQYPQLSALQIMFLAGRGFDAWQHSHRDELEAYARRQGCSEIHLSGRAGWARKLASEGYSEQYRVLRKVLE